MVAHGIAPHLLQNYKRWQRFWRKKTGYKLNQSCADIPHDLHVGTTNTRLVNQSSLSAVRKYTAVMAIKRWVISHQIITFFLQMASTEPCPYVSCALQFLPSSTHRWNHIHSQIRPTFYPRPHRADTPNKMEHISHFTYFNLFPLPAASLYAYQPISLQSVRSASHFCRQTQKQLTVYPPVHDAHTTNKIRTVSHSASYPLSPSPAADTCAYSPLPRHFLRPALQCRNLTLNSPPATPVLKMCTPQARRNTSISQHHSAFSHRDQKFWPSTHPILSRLCTSPLNGVATFRNSPYFTHFAQSACATNKIKPISHFPPLQHLPSPLANV